MDIPRARICVVLLWALSAIAAIAAHGCGGPTFIVQHYSGAPRPAETIGIIRLHGSEPLILASIDGEPSGVGVAEDARMHIEVLPGKHTIGIANASEMTRPPEMISFLAEAGKVYRPILIGNDQARQLGYHVRIGAARVYEVDSSTDALIRDVTLSDTAKPESDPPGAAGEALKPAKSSLPQDSIGTDVGSAGAADGGAASAGEQTAPDAGTH